MKAPQIAAAVAALAAAAAAAQAIDIRTPQLPPRGAAAAPPAQQPPAATVQPGHGAAPGYGQPSPPYGAPAQPGYGQPSSPYEAGPQPPYGAQAGAQVASPIQQRRGGGYVQQPGYGASAQAPVAMVATPSAAGGHCRVQPSPHRQTLSLVGPDGLPRRHVPLGEFRVQRVVHSDDGAWAVAITKRRGENQFAAMTLDLARCEAAHTVDLPASAEEVRFEADAAVVRLAQGERRVPLKSGLVR